MLMIDRLFCTWNELVEKFPNKWIVVEDAELTNAGFIKSGKLIGVCDDSEIDDFVVSCYREDKNINYERTTEGSGVEIINVEDFKYAVK
jgi:hypothetical protein